MSGTTTRNIRGYQERGLLPKPLRRGRVAIYTEKHVRNLLAINKLLSKGFTLGHIATFLTNPGARIGDALDLTEILDEPWATGKRPVLEREDLEARLGPLDDAALTGLIDAGVLAATEEPDRYEAADPHIVGNLARLVDKGMDLAVLIDVQKRFAAKLAEAAEILMTAAHDEVDRRRGPGWLPATDEDVAWAVGLLGAMRRAGTENAHAALDRALDTALDQELQAHKIAAGNRTGADAS